MEALKEKLSNGGKSTVKEHQEERDTRQSTLFKSPASVAISEVRGGKNKNKRTLNLLRHNVFYKQILVLRFHDVFIR